MVDLQLRRFINPHLLQHPGPPRQLAFHITRKRRRRGLHQLHALCIELLAKLRAKGRTGKSRRSGTEGARFSRVVALATNAMRKGKWSTGADIDRDEVFERMMSRFRMLQDKEFMNITGNARESLVDLCNSKTIKPTQRKELKDILDRAGIRVD